MGSAKRRPGPSIRIERAFARQHGAALVAGIDEAGRGPIAGPVVAAAVAWDHDRRRPPGIADSKIVPAPRRERLFDAIRRHAASWGIGVAEAAEIDSLNILEAIRLAARRALDAMDPPPQVLVTDALELPGVPLPTLAITKADRDCSCVAAASILAKVARDRLMDGYHREFPEYGWDENRGYPTAGHYEALERHGPTILHRMTYSGVGFFEVPRASPSGARLLELARRDPALARAEAMALGDQLPPPDRRAVLRATAHAAAAAGAPLE